MKKAGKAEFNKTLFLWHKKNYRKMEWRDTHDPYRILVSELMLQQTQVARVKEKYPEFIKKFPTVSKLATAPLGDVLRLWSGLGYNRRAKFLHQCAKQVVSEYGGKFPDTYEELVTLSGVGRSTAGALLAFAFGADTPMIDTNIRRILIRVFFLGRKLPTDSELYDFAVSIIPKGKGREWNYAMLDLGATLCSARNHKEECPLMKLHGNVGDFVYKKPQKKFADSGRFYRGKLVKYLSTNDSISFAGAKKLLIPYTGEVSNLLESLVKEGLISKKKAMYSLPK